MTTFILQGYAFCLVEKYILQARFQGFCHALQFQVKPRIRLECNAYDIVESPWTTHPSSSTHKTAIGYLTIVVHTSSPFLTIFCLITFSNRQTRSLRVTRMIGKRSAAVLPDILVRKCLHQLEEHHCQLRELVCKLESGMHK